MIVDKFTQLSAAQVIAAAATTLFTNVVDLSAADPDIGAGNPMGFQLSIQLAADFTTGDETYEWQLIGDDDPTMATPVVLAKYPILTPQLLLGDTHFLPFPSGVMTERYLSGQILTVGTTPIVTFSIDIRPQNMSQAKYKNYPKGYVIS